MNKQLTLFFALDLESRLIFHNLGKANESVIFRELDGVGSPKVIKVESDTLGNPICRKVSQN